MTFGGTRFLSALEYISHLFVIAFCKAINLMDIIFFIIARSSVEIVNYLKDDFNFLLGDLSDLGDF